METFLPFFLPLFFLFRSFLFEESIRQFSRRCVFSLSARYLTTFRSCYLKFSIELRASVFNTNGTCSLKKKEETKKKGKKKDRARICNLRSLLQLDYVFCMEPSRELFDTAFPYRSRKSCEKKSFETPLPIASSRYY